MQAALQVYPCHSRADIRISVWCGRGLAGNQAWRGFHAGVSALLQTIVTPATTQPACALV